MVAPEFMHYFALHLADDATVLIAEALHPLTLRPKVATSDANNPTWTQGMNSPDAHKWFDAMEY
jgi:hypothetical protein